MSNPKKKTAKKVSKKKLVKIPSKFRIWCFQRGIQQKDIKEKTKLSVGCIHSMWNSGKSTLSSIRAVALAYDIDEAKLAKMISEPASEMDLV